MTKVALRGSGFSIVAGKTAVHVGLVFSPFFKAVTDVAVTIGTGIWFRCKFPVADLDRDALDYFFHGRRVTVKTKVALDID